MAHVEAVKLHSPPISHRSHPLRDAAAAEPAGPEVRRPRTSFERQATSPPPAERHCAASRGPTGRYEPRCGSSPPEPEEPAASPLKRPPKSAAAAAGWEAAGPPRAPMAGSAGVLPFARAATEGQTHSFGKGVGRTSSSERARLGPAAHAEAAVHAISGGGGGGGSFGRSGGSGSGICVGSSGSGSCDGGGGCVGGDIGGGVPRAARKATAMQSAAANSWGEFSLPPGASGW